MPDRRHAGDPASRLQRLAASVVEVYGQHPELDVAYITGSVARGWADRWSDLEMVLCWRDVPTEEARVSLAGLAGASSHRAFPADPATGQVDEELLVDSIKADLIHVTTVNVADVLDDVTVQADESVHKHVLVAGIRDGLPVAGEETFRRWQAQAVVYPATLRRAVILRNLVFGPHWWLEMLADRNDLLLLHQTFCRIEVAILNILLALNESYPPGEAAKWSSRIARSLTVAPPHLATRLETVLTALPEEGVREAGLLIPDTLDLIEKHTPEIDVKAARARILSSGRS